MGAPPAARRPHAAGALRIAGSFAILIALALAISVAFPIDADAQGGAAPRAVVHVPVETALSADTVTVGDRFGAVLRAWFPPGSWIELEMPADSDSVQFVAPPRTTMVDSVSGHLRVDVEMVAWRTGTPDTLRARARMVMADGTSRTVETSIPLPFVRSVLPADPARHVPRGPKDVWGPSRPWGKIALIAVILLLLLLSAIAAWLLIRRLRRRRAVEPYRTPREAALAALEEARASGLAEAGEWKAFYSLVSAALRRYAMATRSRWSTDLTTRELLKAIRADGVPDDELRPLAHLLRVADLAKFARAARTRDDARRDLDAARLWVESFGPSESGDEGDGGGDAGDGDRELAGAGAGEGAR